MEAGQPGIWRKVFLQTPLLALLGTALVAALGCTRGASSAFMVDTEPPRLVMLAPSNGSMVSGHPLLEVQASDNSALESVQYRISPGDAQGPLSLAPDPDSGYYNGALDTTSMPDGSYTLEVQARDVWGNLSSMSAALTIDNPPSVPIGLAYIKPSSPSNGGHARISWVVNPDSDVAYYNVYRSDSSDMTSAEKMSTTAESAFQDQALTNGASYYYAVSAVDKSGNESPLSLAILVTPQDTLPPTISNLATAKLDRTGVHLLWSTDEPAMAEVVYGPGISFALETKGSAEAGTSLLVPLSGLKPDTIYAYRVRAVDAAGNETVSDIFTFTTLADQAPTLSIQAPTPDAYIRGSVLVSVNAEDDWALDSVEYALNDGEFQSMGQAPGGLHATNLDTTKLEDGVHTITARARDDAGQMVERKVTVRVDNSVPQVLDVDLLWTKPRRASISWTTSEPAAASIEYGKSDQLGSSAPSGEAADQSHNVTLEGLEPGAVYHYRIRATDAAGNESVSPISTFTLPTDAKPTVTILSPEAGASLKGTLTIQVRTLDDSGISSVQYALDSRPLQPMPAGSGENLYEVTINTAQAGNGPHTIKVLAVDDGEQSAQAEMQTVFDNVKPIVTGVAVSNIGRFRADVQWRTNEPSIGFVEYGTTSSLGSATEATTSTDFHLVTLADLTMATTFYYRVRSSDAAGNETVSNIVTFSTPADKPPSVSIVGTAPTPVLYGLTRFQVKATDDWGVTSVVYSIDERPFTPMMRNAATGLYEVSFNVDPLGAGNHLFTVLAEDDRGLRGLAQKTISIDTLPSISVLGLTEGARVSGSVQFGARANDNGSIAAVEYAVDQGSFGPMALDPATGNYTASINTLALASGAHILKVRARDNLGLVSETSLSLTVNHPPSVALVAPDPAAASLLGGSATTIQANATSDFTTVASVQWQGLFPPAGSMTAQAIPPGPDPTAWQPLAKDQAAGLWQAPWQVPAVVLDTPGWVFLRATDAAGNITESAVRVTLAANGRSFQFSANTSTILTGKVTIEPIGTALPNRIGIVLEGTSLEPGAVYTLTVSDASGASVVVDLTASGSGTGSVIFEGDTTINDEFAATLTISGQGF